jgi:hypothetical protein
MWCYPKCEAMMQKVTLEIKMSKKSKIYKQVPAKRTLLNVAQTGEVFFFGDTNNNKYRGSTS